tara:strand:- start:827 stop:1000 length:174 start_codon:yes stop_codon:yes gene_type:complete
MAFGFRKLGVKILLFYVNGSNKKSFCIKMEGVILKTINLLPILKVSVLQLNIKFRKK